MRNLMLAWLITSSMVVLAKSSIANDQLSQFSENPATSDMHTGNCANDRHS
jgi:hypothetical protein